MNIDAFPAPYAPATRVLLVADEKSPTTWGWVEAIRSSGVVVLGLDGQPWPEQQTSRENDHGPRADAKERLRSLASATPRRLKMAQRCRRTLGPLLASIKGRRLRRIFKRVNPDVVHALRIPYEAMVGVAACPQSVPFTVSIWGNDLTLHASTNRIIARFTRRVLARADMLFADCQRDIDLAQSWGFRAQAPTALLAGGGGIRLDRIIEARCAVEPRLSDLEGSSHRLIVNARGCREYVRNDVLIEALSLLSPDLDTSVRIIFVDAAHDKALRRSVESYPLAHQTIVTGKFSRSELLSLFSRTEIYVSITDHDGTPNSFLESMAAGAIPVCGDLPSIREWITHGFNGFLAASDDPGEVAEALRLALGLSVTDRNTIKAENAQIIAARAEQGSTGRLAADNYCRLAMIKAP